MGPNTEAMSFRQIDRDLLGSPPRPVGSTRASGPVQHATSEHGNPVTFGGTTGFFYPGTGSVAVVMLSAIGYEELCLRTTWRSLAGRIADAGLGCLRFDYPGTGDALDPEADPQGLADWRRTLDLAVDLVRSATGARRLVLIGQGLGGALAAAWARDLDAVEGCVLMAPVSNGRRYLRELSIWSRIVTDRIGIGPDPDDATRCGVAGFILPAARIAAIRDLDLAALDMAPARNMLLVERPGHAGDEALANHLGALGAAVTRLPYGGYETLTMDPTAAVPPADTLAAVVRWTTALAAAGSAASAERHHTPIASPLRRAGLVERPLRFGPGGRLFGVLCEPDRARAETVLVLVNAGRDYHIGWGRVTVDQARAFAKRGIASFRFDAGGIGDSPPSADGPAEILYSQAQIDDVRAAVDLVEAAGYRDIVVVGRCSGAHAAFNAAVTDARVGRVVLVNIERFLWDPDENIAEALRYGHRSLGNFGATLKSRDGLKRLLTGRMRVRAAGLHLAYRFAKAASLRLAPVVGPITKQGRFFREVHRRLGVLAARGAKVALIFAEGDLGLHEFHRYFDPGGRRLGRHPGLSFRLVEDADHNFTHAGARSRLLDVMVAALGP